MYLFHIKGYFCIFVTKTNGILLYQIIDNSCSIVYRETQCGVQSYVFLCYILNVKCLNLLALQRQ